MKKDIFKTLNDYTSGFHRTATQEDCAIYDAEIERIKARILADVEHSPEIIAEEFAKFWVIEYRKLFSGKFSVFETTPEYKAVDNIYMTLLDSKPLKSLPLRCNAEQNASKIDKAKTTAADILRHWRERDYIVHEYIAASGKKCYRTVVGNEITYQEYCKLYGLDMRWVCDFHYTAKGDGYELDYVERDMILAIDN